jgi:hypothetical protein
MVWSVYFVLNVTLAILSNQHWPIIPGLPAFFRENHMFASEEEEVAKPFLVWRIV